jgi:pimeloyl-ACP methyl ester carboxylesterase
VLIAPNTNSNFTKETFQEMLGLPDRAMVGLTRKIERRFGASIFRDINGEDVAPSVRTPALVFHDPEDPQVRFEGSERLVRVWTGAELIQAPGLGHGSITRDPSVIERAVAFVRGGALPVAMRREGSRTS